jgi:acetyl esterase
MPVDAEIQRVLDMLKGAPPMESLPLDALRASVPVPPLEARPRVGTTEDIIIPGAPLIPARIYRPVETRSEGLVIFLHGGGFVIGNLETHDHVCRDLCRRAGIVVLAVDYRLAPEAKFPAAVDDSVKATCWAARNASRLSIDPGKIIVAGDSAGGNLAAVTAIRLRDEDGPPLRGQLLIYPVTDYHTPGTASYITHASGFSLTRGAMIRFWREYLADETYATHVHAAPLRASDLSNLPPALVLTAEFDPLRDEGEAFARKLADAGVAVTLKRYDGLIHGFFRMAAVSKRANSAIDDAVAWMHQVLR